MAIAVQCPECHKKYNAPDHLAGRRVKCKYCGIAFLIAADSRTSDPDFNLDDLSALSGMGDASNRAAAAASAKAKAAGEDDVDALFRAEFSEEGAPRTNKLYIFPMSRLLDRWLPPFLLLIGVVWMVREAFERNDTTELWVGFFRAAMFLLAFFAAVFPFTLMGVRAAGRKLNFEMPPNPALRVLGTFAVPFALACALWLIYGEVSGLLFGVLLGVVVALPVLFLLFRLLPVEAPITFAYAAGSFLVSVVVAVAGLIALNLMLVGILRSLRTEYTLAVSPFGPGFKWDAPAETPQLAEGTEAETQPTTEPAVTTKPSTHPTSPATTSPSQGTVASVDPNPTAPATSPTIARTDVPTGTDQAATGGTVETKPTQPMPPVTPTDAAQRPPRAALVADVQDILLGDQIQQVVQPAVPGPWVALVRGDGAGGAEDRVERWNTEKRQKDGEARISRDPAGNHYALSPDGAYLAYLSDFPALSVQVWSFADNRLLRPVRLARDNTAPHRDQRTPILVGFSTRENVVLHWTGGQDSILEVINVNAPPARPRPIAVAPFEHDPATFAVSPDGQSFAVVTRSADGGDLESVSLTTGKPIKQMPIVDLDWTPDVRVTAVSYTPDGNRIAAVFQKEEGEAVLLCWPALGRSGAAQFWYVLPPVQPPRNPDGSSAFMGPAMQWLEGGESWLYYGAHVFDTDKGTRLGDLSTPGVRAQWTNGRDTCFLAGADPLGAPALIAVKLDLAKARAAADAGSAGGSPGDTTTSRTSPRTGPR